MNVFLSVDPPVSSLLQRIFSGLPNIFINAASLKNCQERNEANRRIHGQGQFGQI
jgi:hypothetical protein